jgi:putative transposase
MFLYYNFCMPRPSRIVVPGVPHHVTHRGNHREQIFFSEQDYLDYLSILKKQCKRTGLDVHGYCFMPNHIHLIATPPTVDALSSGIGQAHHLYSQALHEKRSLTGYLWEGRFYSCPMDENHFIQALLYVDQNPCRAGLVRNVKDWQWSSAQAHAGLHDPGDLVDVDRWREWSKMASWKELTKKGIEDSVIEDIRAYTRKGRPLGDKTFHDAVEEILGFPVISAGAGRPRSR